MVAQGPPGHREIPVGIVVWIAGALLLGGFAALLPWLAGDPPGERAALRVSHRGGPGTRPRVVR